MQIELPTIEGRLLRRYKRFLTDVQLPGEQLVTAHCPNTGSLRGCLPEGARVVLRDSQDPKRKLRYTFQTVEVDGTWVNVDTGLPNALVAEAIQAGRVPELEGYSSLRREVRYSDNSRIDILLESQDGQLCYVEVKSTTLVRDGVAQFPDAVTTRGRKHLEDLEAMVREGHRAVIFLCISRVDAQVFAPADDIDPEWGAALRRVLKSGVEALAYTTLVEPRRFEIAERLPLRL